jgi:Transposase DDE domain
VAKQALILGLVNDALALIARLGACRSATSRPTRWDCWTLVAGQNVEPGDQEGTWRIAQRVATDRVISVLDPEARHLHKSRSEYRDGYKPHVAVEPDTGIVTGAALTPANAGDGPTGVRLLDSEDDGCEVYADSAYGSGDTGADIRRSGHDPVIKPIPLRPVVPGGFTRDDFITDRRARTASCPDGHTVPITAFTANAARCARSAPPRPTVALSGSARMTTSSSTVDRPGASRSCTPTTASTVRWSSARSPGSWHTATAVSPPGACTATSSGCSTASPR